MEQTAEGLRILLVEDNAGFRETVRQVLSSAPGCVLVGEAADGSEALALAEALEPQVVLLDVGLPGTNGLEVAQAFRRQIPGTVVVMLLSDAETVYLRAAEERGAAWVVKDRLVADLPPLLAQMRR